MNHVARNLRAVCSATETTKNSKTLHVENLAIQPAREQFITT